VIGFVSQFFFIDIGSLSSSTLAVPRAQTAGLAATTTRAKAHGWMPPRGVRHDDSDSPGEGVFVDRRHRRKSRNPGVASLTSPRNFINTAAAAFEGAGRLCASSHPVRFSGHPSRRTGQCSRPKPCFHSDRCRRRPLQAFPAPSPGAAGTGRRGVGHRLPLRWDPCPPLVRAWA
jgi:hypothetical protein